MSLCCKAKTNTPLMYEVLDKDTLKSEIPLHLSAAKHSYASKMAWWKSSVNARSTSWKPAADARLLLRLHDAVSAGREQCALQPLALAVVSVRIFRAVTHVCVYGTIVFCLVFSKNFNIITALSVNQSPILPQRIDSRGGLFWCKLGLACECSKMYFYLKRPPFAPVSELFGAKWSAFCCKMECILVLNATHFDAKRKPICR